MLLAAIRNGVDARGGIGIIGHSYGGGTAVQYAHNDHRVSAMVVSSVKCHVLTSMTIFMHTCEDMYHNTACMRM